MTVCLSSLRTYGTGGPGADQVSGLRQHVLVTMVQFRVCVQCNLNVRPAPGRSASSNGRRSPAHRYSDYQTCCWNLHELDRPSYTCQDSLFVLYRTPESRHHILFLLNKSESYLHPGLHSKFPRQQRTVYLETFGALHLQT